MTTTLTTYSAQCQYSTSIQRNSTVNVSRSESNKNMATRKRCLEFHTDAWRSKKKSANSSSMREQKEILDFVSKPEIVGYFGHDKDGNYLADSSKLMYYNRPDEGVIDLNLNDGINERGCIAPSLSPEYLPLDHLMEWIKLNLTKVEAPAQTDRRIQPHFVCSYDLLSQLIRTPFGLGNIWKMRAAKWKGTIYLSVNGATRFTNVDEEEFNRCSYWGSKFHQYLRSDSPDKIQDPSKPVENDSKFHCVYQRKFGDHTILYDATMKCVDSEERLTDPLPLNNLNFIEYRLSRFIEHSGQENTLRQFKFLKWWCRGYLTGIENLLCGFRNKNGIVQKITTYTLDDMIEKSKDYWNPPDCVNYTVDFLNKISKAVVNDCNETIYEFKISKEKSNVEDLTPTPENAVIPSSYMEHFELQK